MQFFKDVLSRIEQLIIKLISVKVIIGGVATWLMYYNRLDPWVWFAVMLSIISARSFEKKVESIKIGR